MVLVSKKSPDEEEKRLNARPARPAPQTRQPTICHTVKIDDDLAATHCN